MVSSDDPIEYFARTFFAFVPNVCNAQCAFCYVEPVMSGSAELSASVLEYASHVAVEMAGAGFTEVRLTGGDPLVFRNISDLIDIFTSAGLSYRILTNGLGLSDEILNYFMTNPPDRVLVSVHDADDPGSVLGVAVDVESYFTSLAKCAAITELECTVVVLDTASSRVRDLLDRMQSLGASHAKIIFENSKRSRAHMTSYERMVSDMRAARLMLPIRVTSTSAHSCKLHSKGFLSVDLARRAVYQCCAQVGDRQRSMQWDIVDDLTTRLHRAMATAKAQTQEGLPCDSYFDACPIALEDL